jgi:hypothetical protein
LQKHKHKINKQIFFGAVCQSHQSMAQAQNQQTEYLTEYSFLSSVNVLEATRAAEKAGVLHAVVSSGKKS